MKSSSKFLFINNNTFSGNGLSGGDRIWTELMKNWSKTNTVDLLGSDGALEMAKVNDAVPSRYYSSASLIYIKSSKILVNPIFLIGYIFSRTYLGILSVIKNISQIKKYSYVYSVSDFYPDFFPSLLIKIIYPNIKWMTGFYLFAPNPFSKHSPYKGIDRIKGLFYWLMQIPSYYLAKFFADYVFVTSEPDVAKFITSRRDKSKIIVIQGGVVTSYSDKYFIKNKVIPVADRKYDACFVGRFHQQKGVVELIDIWNKVVMSRPKAKLIMIGNGAQKDIVKNKINSLGLNKNIILRGFLDGELKHNIFMQSKIIVHPAIYDSGGMAAAEGMAWGLPGVTFDLEALVTYYPKGVVKTPEGDVECFAKNILKLLNDERLYKKTSEDAYKLIREVWDWKKRSKKILKTIMQKSSDRIITERCRLCGGTSSILLFKSANTHGRHMLDKRKKYFVCRCNLCDSVFLSNLIVNRDYFKKSYDSSYYIDSKKANFIEQIWGYFSRILIKFKNDWLSTLGDRKKRIKILDIGCGNGDFLSSLPDKKFDKCGVEINKDGVASCLSKGIFVYDKAVEKVSFGKTKFDIITMWHVFEHLDKPTKTLRKVSKILSKKGVLIIQVPNSHSLGFKIGKENWFHLDSPRHLQIPSQISMEKILKKNGFVIHGIKNHFFDYPLDLFWSVRKSNLKYLVYPLYPFFKFFSKEHLTYIIKLNRVQAQTKKHGSL